MNKQFKAALLVAGGVWIYSRWIKRADVQSEMDVWQHGDDDFPIDDRLAP